MTVARVAAVLITAAGIPVRLGSTALAADGGPSPQAVSVSLNCGPAAHFFYSCSVTHTGVGATVRWYVNGLHRPEWTNRTTVADACSDGHLVSVRARVTAPNGSGQDTDEVICQGNG